MRVEIKEAEVLSLINRLPDDRLRDSISQLWQRVVPGQRTYDPELTSLEFCVVTRVATVAFSLPANKIDALADVCFASELLALTEPMRLFWTWLAKRNFEKALASTDPRADFSLFSSLLCTAIRHAHGSKGERGRYEALTESLARTGRFALGSFELETTPLAVAIETDNQWAKALLLENGAKSCRVVLFKCTPHAEPKEREDRLMPLVRLFSTDQAHLTLFSLSLTCLRLNRRYKERLRCIEHDYQSTPPSEARAGLADLFARLACHSDSVALLDALVTLGYDPSREGRVANRHLLTAVQSSSLHLVLRLLELGCDPQYAVDGVLPLCAKELGPFKRALLIKLNGSRERPIKDLEKRLEEDPEAFAKALFTDIEPHIEQLPDLCSRFAHDELKECLHRPFWTAYLSLQNAAFAHPDLEAPTLSHLIRRLIQLQALSLDPARYLEAIRLLSAIFPTLIGGRLEEEQTPLTEALRRGRVSTTFHLLKHGLSLSRTVRVEAVTGPEYSFASEKMRATLRPYIHPTQASSSEEHSAPIEAVAQLLTNDPQQLDLIRKGLQEMAGTPELMQLQDLQADPTIDRWQMRLPLADLLADYSCDAGNIRLLSLLFNLGYDVQRQRGDVNHLLVRAIRVGAAKSIGLLMAWCCNANLPSKEGYPLILLRQTPQRHLVAVLNALQTSQFDLDWNVSGPTGWSAQEWLDSILPKRQS